MSEPDLLERTRMALAEVGYDPLLAVRRFGGVWLPGQIPPIDRWRAYSIALQSFRQLCYECSLACSFTEDIEVAKAGHRSCRADRPLVRDCGLPR